MNIYENENSYLVKIGDTVYINNQIFRRDYFMRVKENDKGEIIETSFVHFHQVYLESVLKELLEKKR